jgi:hypothetical protein
MIKRLLLPLLVLALASASVFSQTKTAPAKTTTAKATPAKTSKKTEFFPLDQLKPGMRATGYTVFTGSEPQPFELEILGVMKGFSNPQQSAILSRLVGAQVEHTGVFQGMSGSPVYIDGKLLGAVAFGYQFAKDPIAGITPIQQMIDVFERRPAEGKTNSPRPLSFSEIAFDEKSQEFADFVAGKVQGAVPMIPTSTGSPSLVRIATPLAVNGISPEVLNRFTSQFQSLGFTPVAGVAGAAAISEMKPADDSTLRPGSTIVVPLIRGDLSVAAAGTVTYRDGDRIYAFGHPLFSLGVSDFPMNEGEVVTVMSSSAVSFKLTTPGAMVGAVRGDRSTAIYGDLGAAPKMIPVQINLRTSRGTEQKYRFEMVADRFLTPILMQMTTLSTISSTERTIGDSTLQLRGKLQIKGQPQIDFENRFATSVNAPLAAAFAASQPINALLNSGFDDLVIEGVTLEITSLDVRHKGQLDRLWVGQTEVRRGDRIEIQAFARAENGGEYVERVSVEVPKDAPLGSLRLIVGDGAALQSAELRAGITPKTLNSLVRELNRIRKADRLYVRLERADNGVVINNEEMPNLPPSVLATLGSDRTAGGYIQTRATALYERELPPADFVISGQRTLTIKVID